jgi:hypothetical protein
MPDLSSGRNMATITAILSVRLHTGQSSTHGKDNFTAEGCFNGCTEEVSIDTKLLPNVTQRSYQAFNPGRIFN